MEEACGPEALRHKNRNKEWTADQRYELVAQVLAERSVKETAFSAGINSSLLYQWVQRYKTEGYQGLTTLRKGRLPKETPMKKEAVPTELTPSEREEMIRLREENERLRAENAVIKKEDRLERRKTGGATQSEKAALVKELREEGYRSFPLLDEAREIFLQAKKEEKENRRLMGKDYQDNAYVFKWPDGRPISPDYVTHHFPTLLDKYNLPRIRFHELRHSCASLLLSNGFALKDVQEWLGHSDIKMTANIYGHLDVARKQSIADKMGSLFSSAEFE